MKNTIFWFITFAIIVTVVVVTVILTQDFSPEKNETTVWIVSIFPICGRPWDIDEKTRLTSGTDKISSYYENHHIEIHDLKIFLNPDEKYLRDTCWYPDSNLFLLIGESDVTRMLNSGFTIAEGNTTKQQYLDAHNYLPKSLD